ncbi:unnamed protein product [Rotaria sp. Silwood1]|nr:unnamed protein product [Rotaria sp. Silwood1]
MLFGSDGKKILWRKPDEEFGAECLVPRAQQNGGNWKFSMPKMYEISQNFLSSTLQSSQKPYYLVPTNPILDELSFSKN